MRKAAYTLVTVALLAIGFGGGYFVRSIRSTDAAELEDQALGSVSEDVVYAHYIAKGDYAAMRSLLDVHLNTHLSRLRAHSGAISDAQFEDARTRMLNAAALIWDAYPPFQSAEWLENPTNSSWWKEWSNDYQLNLALLHAAKERCAAIPALHCKAKPPAARVAGEGK